MSLYKRLLNKDEKLSVIGLGYVGMPLAVAFAKKIDVVGFDLNKNKVNEYLKGIDATGEVGDEAIKNTSAKFTCNENKIKDCKFHVVAVPTPINDDKTPNLNPVIGASEVVGRNLTKGAIVVFESTVYPGVTEEVCIPILEKESGLKCGKDFKVGYSPERINPGDKIHRLETIVKIVSGMDEYTLQEVASVYELIIEAGVHRAESIKVAEAAKVIENSQRDINIAFINELSMIFNEMNINTRAVLDAANTKWNFLDFRPGLVGGHCIGVDPFYLVYKAKQFGYESKIISNGRKINDQVPKFVVDNTIKLMIKNNKMIKGAKVGIFGVTFKENCPDCRNSKVIDIINELEDYGVEIKIYDPVANKNEIEFYGYKLSDEEEVKDLDCAIFAVNHSEFNIYKNIYKLDDMFTDKKIIIDIKNIFSADELISNDYIYWTL